MRLIVFDVDGTLVDSQHHIVAAQARAFAAHGLRPPPRATALSVVGLSLDEAFVALAGAQAPIASLAAAYKDAWADIRRQPSYEDPIFPGARETLAQLAARPDVLLGIATGKSRRGVALLLESQGWARWFSTVQTADDHPSKPHPAMLRAAMAETDVAAASTAMVGDTSFDMAMAVAAEVRPLGVAWGYHEPDALRAAGAASVAESFSALLASLAEIPARVSDSRNDLRRDLGPAANGPIDPVTMARRDLQKTLPRRFYRQVAVAAQEGGFGPVLDGKPVRTPAKAALVVPTHDLAQAIADEWAGQGEIVDPDTMPLTRLANSALDGVARTMAETAAEVQKFAESDLVCYRAADPATLVAAQAEAWDPVLSFAREVLGARLVMTQGILFVAQPEPALAAVGAAVAAIVSGPAAALRLAALSVMTSLTGSVLIALAVARGAMDVEAAWAAANVDEDYQMRHWGADAEALARRDRRRREMIAAATLFTLAG